MNTILVSIVSAESSIYTGSAEYIIAPAVNGEIGIYPKHAPLLGKLKPGVVRIKLPNQETQEIFAISGGFIEVHGTSVVILADIVVRSDELDEARLLEQKQIAQAKLNSSDLDYSKAYTELELVIAQLKALDYINKSLQAGK